MAYVAPTAAEIKTRFPEFAAVDTSLIDQIIAEANRFVDSSWIEADYKIAIQFLTAHMLVTGGALNPDGAAAQAVVSGPIKSESLGDASVSYSDSSVSSGLSAEESELMSTNYGRRFAAIRRANHLPVLVI